MSAVVSLARPEIQALKAYRSARSLVASESASVYLHANESPFAESGLNRYPEPQPRALVERLCELYGVRSQQLLIGRGSDEAIDLLVRTFCRAGQDNILICPPTYGVYEISAQIQGAGIKRIPLLLNGQVRLDHDGIASALGEVGANIKMVFLCSPNNPTGTAFSAEELARVCAVASGRALVVVDEAYVEFSDVPSLSESGALAQFENLVLLRTLSKAWALAGARCGVAIGAPSLIALLHKVRAPYPLSKPAVDAVLAVTDRDGREKLDRDVTVIRSSRQRLSARLAGLADVEQIFESSANFLLVRFRDAAGVMRRTRAAGLVVRDRSTENGLQNCIRITVGADGENEALLKVLRGQ